MNKLYFVLSRFSIGCIMASFLTSLGVLYMIYDTDRITIPVMFGLGFVFSLLGYGLKYLFSRLSLAVISDEVKKGLVPFVMNTLIPLLAVLVCSYLFSLLPDGIFDLFREAKTELLPLQRDSYRFGITSYFAIGILLGVLVWRKDADEVYSEPVTLVAGCGGVGICYCVKLAVTLTNSTETVEHGMYSVLILIVISAYALLTSQLCVIDIRNSAREHSSNKSEYSALLYNLVMLIFVVPFFALLVLVSRLGVNGVYVIIRLVAGSILKNPEIASIGSGIYGVVDVLSVLFLIILVFLVIFRANVGVTVTKLTGLFTSLIGYLINGALGLFKALNFGKRQDAGCESSEDDEPEIKRQTAPVTEFVFPTPILNRDNFDTFLKKLIAIPDNDSKIGFAYRKMCDLYRRDGVRIKESDTPREVAAKLKNVSENERNGVVQMIEQVKFSSGQLTEDEKEEILAQLCRIIRRQYI